MKPVDAKTNTYIDSSKEVNDKDPKFETGGTVRILKYKSIFAKFYAANLSQEILWLKKFKNTAPEAHVIDYLNGEEPAGRFYGKELKKQFKMSLELKK